MQRRIFPLARPYVGRNSEREVLRILRSGWLTQGAAVDKLEVRLRKYLPARYALLLNSATSGLIIAVKALGLKSDDEVICPAFSFPATANAIILGGAVPCFCDINPHNFNISLPQIEGRISRKTRAVMAVSLFGMPADLPGIKDICRRHNLYLIEDAACALGAAVREKKIGTFGEMGIYSFHPRKVITCGEGGCLVTDSAQFARTAQMLRNHGEFNKRFIGCGYNFRMSDIQAGVLLPQFRKLEGIIRERQRLAANYDQLLRRLKDTGLVTTAQAPAGYRNSHQAYVIMLDRRIKRDRVKSLLRRKGIESQFGTYCIPQTPFFKKAFYSKPSDYPNALFAYKHSLALPLCHGLNFQGQEFIVEAIERAIETVYRIRERMQ